MGDIIALRPTPIFSQKAIAPWLCHDTSIWVSWIPKDSKLARQRPTKAVPMRRWREDGRTTRCRRWPLLPSWPHKTRPTTSWLISATRLKPGFRARYQAVSARESEPLRQARALGTSASQQHRSRPSSWPVYVTRCSDLHRPSGAAVDGARYPNWTRPGRSSR